MARNYPGFLAAFFIILLRVAIGWHFLNEGVEKYESGQHGKEAFSAEIYLRNANGPLAPYFREMIPDVDSRDLLDLSKLKAVWRADADRIADGFGFSEDQKSQASKKVDESERWADAWFSSPENVEKREKYFHDLDEVEKTERNPDALSYQQERAWEARRSLEADRRSLIAPLVEQGKALHEAVANLATSEQVASADNALPRTVGRQLKSAGNWALSKAKLVEPDTSSSTSEPPKAVDLAPRAWTQLDLINTATTYSLIAIGACLILGFLTPLSALGAAAFLAMIYFSMPPWPGLPPNPKTEGHYFIVSKNLVELIACLVIATTPSGHWIGLDALFFGARRRRRLAPPPSNPNPNPNSSVGHDRPVTKQAPGREQDEDLRKPIPIG
jgi:uncharacterized membrane protein YphA (DoxX/SURF4 family)